MPIVFRCGTSHYSQPIPSLPLRQSVTPPHLQAFSTCFFSFRDSSERNIPSRRTRLTLLQVSQVVKHSFNMRSSLYILICPHARLKGVCDKSYSSLLRALFFFNHFPNKIGKKDKNERLLGEEGDNFIC